MDKKKLLYRSLYDFGNSFVFINFLLYFSQRLVIDAHLPDLWYNAIFAIASFLLLFSAPILASITDKFGGRIFFLKISTFGTIISYSLATLFAYGGNELWLIVMFFLIGQYFYQLSFCFHNPLIEDIADTSRRAYASGIGQFANNIGQVGGLMLALAFTEHRLDPLLPSIIICAICSIPLLFYFKEQQHNTVIPPINQQIYSTIKGSGKQFVLFFKKSTVIPVLVAFFFFNDALITVSNNYSIYLEQVFYTPDTTKNLILMAVLLCSAIGAILRGKIANNIGSKKSIIYILISRLILLPILGIVKSISGVIVCSILLGFFMGGIWSVTRAYFSQILQKKELSYGFSFYTLFERFATLVGPLTRGAIISYNSATSVSYRIAMISMSVYILMGLIVVYTWQRK